MPPIALQLAGLTKRFGPDRGVFDASFEVETGAIFGFLGPNGAGKTTLIRMVLDFLRPDAGTATVLGLDCRRDSVEVRRRIGYVPAEFRLAENGTGETLLRYLAGFRAPGTLARGRELADRLGVPLDRRIKTFSKGMKQKIALVQALMHDPELLILDEPTDGLDPLMQHALHALLREAAARGRTVFFSSHALGEVDALCDRVAIIGKGRMLAVEDVATLRLKRRRVLRLVLSQPVPGLELPGASLIHLEGLTATFHHQGPAPALLAALATLPLVDFTFEPAPLEEAFMEYYV